MSVETNSPGNYPEATKYAERLPAFGLYFWHVRGVTLEDVQLTSRAPEPRPAIKFEDAERVTMDGKQVDEDDFAHATPFSHSS